MRSPSVGLGSSASKGPAVTSSPSGPQLPCTQKDKHAGQPRQDVHYSTEEASRAQTGAVMCYTKGQTDRSGGHLTFPE